MAISTWQYLVDWNADGDFTDYLEDITLWVKSASWQIGMHDVDQRLGDETRLTLTLKNEDGRFSPENASSPYYGNLLPQRRVKIVATVDGAETTMYLGFIDKIAPEALDGKTCIISVSGAKQYIQNQVVRLPLLENVTTGYVIEQILEQMHLPPSMSGDAWILGVSGSSELGVTTYLADLSVAFDLDTGLTTLPYVGDNWGDNRDGYSTTYDWVEDFRGYDAIRDVVEAERGKFFFSRAGVATFWQRDHLITDLDVACTITGADVFALDYRYGDRVYNDVRVMAYPRAITENPETLWTLDEMVFVDSGVPKEIRARYTDSTDSEAKVGGLDVTVQNYTSGNASAAVDYQILYEAKGATITFTNNTLQRLPVRTMELSGRKVTSANSSEARQVAGLSYTQYGAREMRVDCKLIADQGFAQRVAEYEISRWSDPIGMVYSLTMLVDSPTDERRVITCGMGTRINVVDAQTGHSAEYFIIGEQHERTLGAGHRVTWFLEPADMNTYWILGVAGLSELGQTTYLGL